jgi:aspartyl/asparaginyl beta-hydroxylase (cupin superfamily)
MVEPGADDLAEQAQLAERTGRSPEAAALWEQLVAAYPNHPKALFIRGRRCVERGDLADALTLLSMAERLDSSNAEAPLYIALAHRMSGANEQALLAIDRALSLDPYFLMALLSKGAIQERLGKPRAAARTFANALKVAPPVERLPASQRAALEHAQRAIAANSQALAAFLRGQTATRRAQLQEANIERFDESLDILAGAKPRFVQEPLLFYYPRLPAIPFFDRACFPWLPQLESATDIIREELAGVLRGDAAEFAPYIQFPPEAPTNQWAQLNHSPDWSTYFLWRDGVRQDDNCARCPQTAALLESLPMASQSGYSPTAMFSVLSPRTHIPPHTGSTNVRLITHLPLILPENCRFRVGPTTRDWSMGEAWVFDDTIEHEAWNDSDQLRVILIFDVWNPLLSDAERVLVTELMAALNAYNALDNER